ncbi:MAG: VOC family protein [Chloroflexota bacterium]|nr:VOC family protein [Chloroflexota bacterium]
MRTDRVVETCLYVDDLERACRFYVEILGLSLVMSEKGRHVFLRCGESMVLLFNPHRTAIRDGKVPTHGAHGPVHVAFAMALDEIDSWRTRLRDHGVEIETEIDWPQGGYSLYFRDPAGNSLELTTLETWGLSTMDRYARRLELLSRVDKASLSAKSSEEVGAEALKRIPHLIPCNRAGILAIDVQRRMSKAIALFQRGKVVAGSADWRPLWDWLRIEDLAAGSIQLEEDLRETCSPSLAQKRLLEELVDQDVLSYLTVPLIVQGELVGILNLGSEQPGAFSQEHRIISREIADRLAVAMQNSQLFSEVLASRERLEELSRRLLRVQERERRNLARELHDEVAQTLTALGIILEVMKPHMDEVGLSRMTNAEELVDQLSSQVRELSLNLRPPMLDDLGLLPTLLWYFDRFTAHTGIAVDFRNSGLDRRFRSELELVAYRIVQEALTNVARHSGVKQVTVGICCDEREVILEVSDRGRGFDPELTAARGATGGLSSMQERAALVGGAMEIEARPGVGTTLATTLPVDGWDWQPGYR